MAKQKTISSRNLNAGSGGGGSKLSGIMKPLADLLIPTKRSRGRASTGGGTSTRVSKRGTTKRTPKKVGKSFSSGKAPHTAQMTHTRNGRVVSQRTIASGNMTPQEKALGFPRSALATHTENRAMRNPALRPGDKVVLKGQYRPCPSCKGAMNRAAADGVHVEYHWPDSTSPWIAGKK